MKQSRMAWLESLLPTQTSVSQAERLRSGLGALLGVLLTGLASAWALGFSSATAWLIAPMGASAVLLFAVPASPLAQPWSVIGGNVSAAIIGVSCARFIPEPLLAASVAIFAAIGTMFALRCLHPPSGAVALTAVLGGAAVREVGYGFVVAPVLLNSVLILAVAMIYNRLVGRRYPHSQRVEAVQAHGTADAVPSARLGFSLDDLKGAVRSVDQVLDISVDDLEDLLRRTEQRAFARRFGQTVCADIMSRDVIAVDFATPLAEAWALMQRHALQAMPVIDRGRFVMGLVTRTDFLKHADPAEFPGLGQRLRRLLKRTESPYTDKAEVVGQIMQARAKTVPDSLPIAELVPLMSDAGLHQIAVTDERRRLAGMVTQTDLVAALYDISLLRDAANDQRENAMPRPTRVTESL